MHTLLFLYYTVFIFLISLDSNIIRIQEILFKNYLYIQMVANDFQLNVWNNVIRESQIKLVIFYLIF